MRNPWFRMYQEFATDPKVQMMTEVNQRRLTMLFCFRCNGDETLHDDEIMFQMRVTPEEWSSSKAEFIARGFIDEQNNLLNWNKRQYVSDTSAARVKKHREIKKQECNVTVTPPDTEQNRTEADVVSNETTGRAKSAPEKPPDVFPDVWNDFLRHRRAKKSPLTKTALTRIANEAEKAGWSLNAALTEACARGWQSFKAEWIENDGKHATNQQKSSKTERAKRALDIAEAELNGMEFAAAPTGVPELRGIQHLRQGTGGTALDFARLRGDAGGPGNTGYNPGIPEVDEGKFDDADAGGYSGLGRSGEG